MTTLVSGTPKSNEPSILSFGAALLHLSLDRSRSTATLLQSDSSAVIVDGAGSALYFQEGGVPGTPRQTGASLRSRLPRLEERFE